MSKESVKQRIKAVFKPNGVGSINGANSQLSLTDAISLMYDDLQIQISYLHENVMYKTRSGAGTVPDPYVYSDPLTPASNTLYIDIDNALAPKAYYFSDDAYHDIKADGYVNWGDINGILSAQTDLVAALATKASATDFSSHIANTNNPHLVTKSQVGLGNVDNTSDADKPISTAVSAALALKAALTQLAPDWQSSSAYVIGDIVSHDGKIYEKTWQSMIGGGWQPAEWTERTISYLLSVKANLATIAPQWHATTTSADYYHAGDFVTQNGKLYERNADQTSAESFFFGPAWTERTIGYVLKTHATAIVGKENSANKVIAITAQSTDAQYPSAKCVYDMIGNVESALAELIGD